MYELSMRGCRVVQLIESSCYEQHRLAGGDWLAHCRPSMNDIDCMHAEKGALRHCAAFEAIHRVMLCYGLQQLETKPYLCVQGCAALL